MAGGIVNTPQEKVGQFQASDSFLFAYGRLPVEDLHQLKVVAGRVTSTIKIFCPETTIVTTFVNGTFNDSLNNMNMQVYWWVIKISNKV